MEHIKMIEAELSELKAALANHKVYHLLTELDDIKIFMETHVYAVWDFMSLLKALQNHLTCSSIPWKPVKNPKVARFINEIVFGEESDLNVAGIPKSHFEMYLDAMHEVGANPQKVQTLIEHANTLDDLGAALEQAELKAGEKSFLQFTFQTIASNEVHQIASAFTFGREELIPDMFLQVLDHAKVNCPHFDYYLKRHIELDGDEHGPLSLEMIAALCGEDMEKWQEVLTTAKSALEQRIKLWDEVVLAIEQKNAASRKEAVVHSYQ